MTNPPTWPQMEMFGTENVNTKLIATTIHTWVAGAPTRLVSTRSAANSPKMAPDAPADAVSGSWNSRHSADPPRPASRYTAA